ncbi:MAG: glycoside hydrolase family 15 protein [Chitinispirillaceae bacterium]|nr:glycoside hydrolase family 15 protein [Chitinispirillaceae bacterium]
MSSSIHKYGMGVIGNCSYMAYIDTEARVQWLCMPRFDGSFLFGGLLDKERGGEFSITPDSGPFSTRQYYIKNTNILCTEFHTQKGAFKVTDFAPRFYHFSRYFKPLMLVRKLEPLSGEPVVRVVCTPKGEWGRIEPDIVMASNHIRYLNLESQVRLTTNIPLNYVSEKKSFVLNDNMYCVLTYGEPLEAPLVSTAEQFYQETKKYWTRWVKTASIPALYQDEVIRSALVLKLHQYEDTGGIIASGSTSLPEKGGAGRNWDYRYCWIRDSFYTLNAFSNIGHFEELEKYFYFIQNIVLNEPEAIQPVYGISGDKILTERELPLSGYMNNRPVRIGNNAFMQRQNDVYGQLLTTLLPLYTDCRLDIERNSRQSRLVGWLLDRIAETMETPDSGIWEYRDRQQLHCYTYLFHWAGSKAARKIAGMMHDDVLGKKAEALVRSSQESIERCYHAGLQAYTQAVGTDALDASVLQLINMRYLDPASERAKTLLTVLEKKLMTPEGLFNRYVDRCESGVPETSFLICSFWYIEALANVGRIDDACAAMERILKCSNHLGLLSEDADSQFGQWGNFPQTYSHVGLMNAVYRIAAKQDVPIFY